MSKVICDICGTTYQDTADCCPICGCTRDDAILLGEEIQMQELYSDSRGKGGRFAPSKKKREIFDFDEVNGGLEEKVEEVNVYSGDSGYDEGPQHNTFSVIVLTLLITVLLLAAGFLFVRYYLPNMGQAEETVPPTATTQAPETTEAPAVQSLPCQNLTLTSGTAELTEAGSFFLINVVPFPENTTDPIYYHSVDESIATVDESGRVTAVSEGNTVIYITCGAQQISCEVVCKFVEETTEATTEAATEPVETTEETVAETTAPEIELKLKKSDITLGVGYYVTLRLDCELNPEDIEWSSDHSYIASVDEKGVVTACSKGVTTITAKYGDQEVTCIVRCK